MVFNYFIIINKIIMNNKKTKYNAHYNINFKTGKILLNFINTFDK